MADIFYNFEHEGKMIEMYASTKKEAKEEADGWWDAKCQDECAPTSQGVGYIVKFNYKKNDEVVEIERTKHELHYEQYHGDFAEHNTFRGL